MLAANLHEQGLIYNRMANAADSDQARADHRQTAAERFQDSLAIKRRIGNEAGAADTLGELGKLLRDAGQMNEAIAAFNEALATYRKTEQSGEMALLSLNSWAASTSGRGSTRRRWPSIGRRWR